MGLWDLLHDHPEHTVVLDDTSTLFKDSAVPRVLMATLGGRPGQRRTVTCTIKDDRAVPLGRH